MRSRGNIIVNYTHAELQLRDTTAFSSKKKNREDPGIELVVSSFTLLHFFLSTTVRKTCACADEIARTKEDKTLEPVSSTSRRGARAAYRDEYPRDFGPRIAYTVS